MKKVLVFGASGFVGHTLMQSSFNDVQFIPVVRRSGGYSNEIVLDLAKDDLTKLPTDIDAVMYLAQSSRYREFPEGAEDMLLVNSVAVTKLASWCVQHGVLRFIYSSTANVYGPSNGGLSETDELKPNSFYGFSKKMGEEALSFFRDKLRLTVLRFFTIYGEGQQNMLIPNMISAVRQSREITLAQGEGLKLAPIHVQDVIQLIHTLCVNEVQVEVLNVAGPDVLSLGEIVDEIQTQSSFTPNVIRIEGAVATLYPANNDLLRKVLGEEYNMISFKNGLSGMLKTKESTN